MLSIGHTLVIQQIIALTIKTDTKTMELFLNQLQIIYVHELYHNPVQFRLPYAKS